MGNELFEEFMCFAATKYFNQSDRATIMAKSKISRIEVGFVKF